MAVTTTNSLPPAERIKLQEKMLAVPVPNLVHNNAGTSYPFPANGGDTARFRRFDKLNTAEVPMGNSGVSPPGQVMSAANIDAKIEFYGTYVVINEQVTLQNQDPVLNQAAYLLGVSMRETEDVLTRDMLASTASVIHATGGANGDNPTEISRSDVDEVVRTLLTNDAKPMMDNIEGKDKFGTAPVRNAFFGMCSTDLTGDLDATAGFISTAQYPSQNNISPAEWGTISNIRFFVSSIGKAHQNASQNGNTVYDCYVAGEESYAYIKQDRMRNILQYLGPEYSGPMAMNSYMNFKMGRAQRILNQEWIVNFKMTRSV